MSAPVVRLAAFGLLLALAVGAGAVVGGAIGPEPPPGRPTTTHVPHAS